MSNQELSETILTIRQSLHELAQPLAALTGLIDLLLLDTDGPRLKEILLINEQLERVLQLVGEIRQMAREAAVGEPLRLQPAVHQTQ